jgi:FKBP-type peptidyl-prolyl cis-trans isomerase
MKKIRIIALFSLVCFLLTASSNQTFAGDLYKETPGGIKYQFLRKSKSGKKPVVSNVLFLNLSYYLHGKKDSLLFDSRNIPAGQISLQLQNPSFKTDIMEIFAMMELQDSVSFILPADSFFIKTAGLKELPPHIPKGASLLFHAGLKDIKTIQEMEAIQKEAEAAHQAEAEAQKGMEESKLKAYLKSKNITQTPTASGLVIVLQKAGNGTKPQKGQTVTVHYTGYLLNGTKFDSSVDRGQPFEFKLGEGQVIRGWDEGVGAMEIGSSFQLIIPSELGYGANGAGGSIPPYSPLVFDVELIKAE